ncbi:cell division protein FtsQ/DivIB [Planobispora siamensis]|uniref:POTRA domain-containing protein n=1 Tax=Planobispora siamensis TaxID=936338 RepID=A0A8J3SWD5_9ACTN|nr:FtsQ-type POTRA domain-containing protein [Planobispora siamensis]GIH96748.1 hypothetical protein Psi01_73780 [Planobispora siamensis]
MTWTEEDPEAGEVRRGAATRDRGPRAAGRGKDGPRLPDPEEDDSGPGGRDAAGSVGRDSSGPAGRDASEAGGRDAAGSAGRDAAGSAGRDASGAGRRGAGRRPAGRAAGRGGVWRTAFLALLTVGVVGTAAWLVFVSPVLGVREVRVVGNVDVPVPQIRQAAGVADGTPLATVDVAEVRNRIAAIRQIESVRVSRGWPGTLEIEVVEREPIAVMPVGGKVALVDRYGVVTEIRAVAPPALPVLRLSRPGDPASTAALAVVDALPPELATRVAEVIAPTAETVSLRLRDGRSVLWGGSDRPADKARILTTLLKRPADTYDVSSPDVVTVR